LVIECVKVHAAISMSQLILHRWFVKWYYEIKWLESSITETKKTKYKAGYYTAEI